MLCPCQTAPPQSADETDWYSTNQTAADEARVSPGLEPCTTSSWSDAHPLRQFGPHATQNTGDINRVHSLTNDYNYGDLQLISSTRSWVRVWRSKYGSSPFTSPPFDPGSPKFLEYTPLPVTIIAVIYNSSAQAVYELECGTKMRVKPPCSPSFWSMALKNNRAHLKTIVILCADNGLSSTVNF